jgi:hypothetical protein
MTWYLAECRVYYSRQLSVSESTLLTVRIAIEMLKVGRRER